jgi:hypothetical protein
LGYAVGIATILSGTWMKKGDAAGVHIPAVDFRLIYATNRDLLNWWR